MDKRKITSYNVWVEIEEVINYGEDYRNDEEPENIAECLTEKEARELRIAICEQFEK
jgi:hypothetical protein